MGQNIRSDEGPAGRRAGGPRRGSRPAQGQAPRARPAAPAAPPQPRAAPVRPSGRSADLMAQAHQGRVLYVVACAAPPTRDLQLLVRLAQADQWNVCVIVTPSARSFLDAAALERLTGSPVRSDYKRPD